MNIRNCPECGKLFAAGVKNLCPKCVIQEEADFQVIKNYLLSNRCADTLQVSQATGISTKRVIKMLHDKRLIAICEDNDIKLLTCERCGKPNISGRFCPECSDLIFKTFNVMIVESMVKQQDCSRSVSARKSLFTGHFKSQINR